MFQQHRASPARLDRSCCPELPPRLVANSDKARAPITFGWFAYTPTERLSKHFHLETLYRFDRVGCGETAALIPSQFYGLDKDQLRKHLVVRQAALLPKLPAGYCWIGPQVVEDLAPGQVGDREQFASVRGEASERLRHAADLARSVLRQRACA